ncbi:MAG: xanthine dehydrogenase family protein subunit M [Amphritea sp.]
MLAEFNFKKPQSLGEALELMAENNNGTRVVPFAGGSNLMLEMRASGQGPDVLMDVGALQELRSITIEGDSVTVGARATVSDILEHPQMKQYAPALVQCAGVFAGQMVRNVATLAGNIGCGSPASDSIAPLLTLDAEVVLQNAGETRVVALNEFFTGYKQNVMRADELITAIRWNRPQAGTSNLFYKVGRRKGDAITVVGVAVSLQQDNGVCSGVRIAMGAVGPMVFRSKKAEAVLQGRELSKDLVYEAAKVAANETSPIDDVRATGEYRKHTVEKVVCRLLLQAAALID